LAYLDLMDLACIDHREVCEQMVRGTEAVPSQLQREWPVAQNQLESWLSTHADVDPVDLQEHLPASERR
jgi:hypothetical protein